MEVSVIVPAYNAASTLAETLESLLSQRFGCWEAIVVDDGSSDDTGTIAAQFAVRDARIRVVNQRQGGESAARNAGVELARAAWLLFLDSDDWLLPSHLERLTNTLALGPNFDGAICGWTRVAPGGRLSAQKHCPQPDNVFELSTRCSPFAIHACVVRRSLVERVGGFDTTLRTCADWDLWQRIARMGARFVTIPDVLARYRMRPGSAGVNGPQILSDALRVITRGHLPDPRVQRPAPAYANGVSAEFLPRAKFHFACWAAGLMIGSGEDACSLLASLGDEAEMALDPNQVAWMIFESVLLPGCRITADWVEIWPSNEQPIDTFLQALETQSRAPGLAIRSRNLLERVVIEHSTIPRPLGVGRTRGVRIEITEPLPDILAPEPAERLLCEIDIEGHRLGTLELPICDGLVPSYVLADAIVAEFAWPILGKFFESTLYQQLEVKHEPGGVSIWKGDLCLADGLPNKKQGFWSDAHSRIGWALFAHEFWETSWPDSSNSQSRHRAAIRQVAKNSWYSAELSGNLPDVIVTGYELQFIPTVGGSAIGVISIPVKSEKVSALEIRAAVEKASGFELGRAAVREAILGQPFSAEPTSLRQRLKIAASRMAQPETAISNLGGGECSSTCTEPGLSGVLHRALPPNGSSIVFAARVSEVIGTSASRRAMLPAAAAAELLEAATVAGEIVVHYENGEQPDRVAYAPDLISGLPRPTRRPAGFGSFLKGGSPPAFRGLRSVLGASYPKSASRRRRATVTLPILMYHRVAPSGDAALARYRVTPQSFEEQLSYLRDAGYFSVSLEEWRIAMRNERPLPGRGVLLTFDDGYSDFLTYAWPLLQHYGFAATVFLVAGEVGKTNRWDRARGEEVALLGWEQIRYLRDEGVEFGSHSASHRPLTSLSPVEIVREGARSRAILTRELGRAPRAFAYPHGDEDSIVRHLIGACGYVFSLSCRFGLSGFYDSLLALPRIEVTGSDTLSDFKKKLGGLEA